MHQNRPTGLGQVAQLLSGHQTAAATIMAASMGDVRLATLISQVRMLCVSFRHQSQPFAPSNQQAG